MRAREGERGEVEKEQDSSSSKSDRQVTPPKATAVAGEITAAPSPPPEICIKSALLPAVLPAYAARISGAKFRRRRRRRRRTPYNITARRKRKQVPLRLLREKLKLCCAVCITVVV